MQESGEMYLETILILGKKNNDVRAIDISKELGYSKPSVSRALSNLKKLEYINILTNGNIILTDDGKNKATCIYEKHCIISEFLIKTLKLNETEADENACRIEHIISDTCFNKIKEYIGKK